MTLITRVQNGIADPSVKVIPAQAHADIAQGKVVQIAYATGITSAPADNDVLGLFGVALEDVEEGEIGAFQIRGSCQAMTGDTSAIGTPVVPMSDMMLNIRPALANDGETAITQTLAFAKLLEAGVVGELKAILILQ